MLWWAIGGTRGSGWAMERFRSMSAVSRARFADWFHLGNAKREYSHTATAALIPGALRSIVALARAGIISSTYQNQTEAASTWETRSDQCFQVNLSIATAETRLEEYTKTLNLTQDLLYGEGSLNGSTTGSEIGGPEQDQSGDMTYYALSLREDGSPIEVSNKESVH